MSDKDRFKGVIGGIGVFFMLVLVASLCTGFRRIDNRFSNAPAQGYVDTVVVTVDSGTASGTTTVSGLDMFVSQFHYATPDLKGAGTAELKIIDSDGNHLYKTGFLAEDKSSPAHALTKDLRVVGPTSFNVACNTTQATTRTFVVYWYNRY